MIAAAATFHVQNVAFGEKESYASLESIGVMAEAKHEYGGGGNPLNTLRWVQIAHDNFNYSWVRVRCQDMVYYDSSMPQCFMAGMTQTWYL